MARCRGNKAFTLAIDNSASTRRGMKYLIKKLQELVLLRPNC
jgi:hypothetical protein